MNTIVLLENDLVTAQYEIDRRDTEIASLKSQLAEAQKDRNRLDWLDSTERGLKGGFYVWPQGEMASGCITSGQHIREAIDAAMETQNVK